MHAREIAIAVGDGGRGWVVDRELVERAQRGDESAFAELATQIADRLYATAHHILRDEDQADDAAQQAMLDMWRELPTLKDPDRFLGWAYRIVVRAAWAESRRLRRWRLPGSAVRRLVPAPAADWNAGKRGAVSDHAERIAVRDELERGFRRLSVDHRTVLVLKHFAGFSNAEIAEVMDVPEGTVRSRLYHAISSLRAALEADARPSRPEIRP